MKLQISSRAGADRDGLLHVVDEHGAVHTRFPARYASLARALEDWRGLLDYLASATGDAVGNAPLALDRPVLARTYQALFASAYGNHAVRVAQQADWHAASLLMYQGASDRFLSNGETIALADEAFELDMEPELGIIVDHVPQGARASDALDHICLVTFCNDFTYRALVRKERALGFGFIQSKPLTSMAPIALTPDALGHQWHDGRLRARLQVEVNGEHFCTSDTGDMEYGFHELIAHAAATRPLAAGTFISSGTISSPRSPPACIVERRAIEVAHGRTPSRFLANGDRVRLEILGNGDRSLFGPLQNNVAIMSAQPSKGRALVEKA